MESTRRSRTSGSLRVRVSLTQHVPLLILPSLKIGDVGLETKVYCSQVLHRIPLWFQSTNEAEALSVMYLMTEMVQISFQRGQLEIVPANRVAVQAKLCPSCVIMDALLQPLSPPLTV
ncbi:hypothetical protein E4U52_000921 [Claviceps spartinae]|nr:hypothetical protein E4U52_000921 [Claviceps spartinae]